jgi:hypothetical protein
MHLVDRPDIVGKVFMILVNCQTLSNNYLSEFNAKFPKYKNQFEYIIIYKFKKIKIKTRKGRTKPQKRK